MRDAIDDRKRMVPNGANESLALDLKRRAVGVYGTPQNLEQLGFDHAAKRLPVPLQKENGRRGWRDGPCQRRGSS